MTTCNNCNNQIQNKFCGFCGQSLSMNGRIDFKDFLTDIFHSIFHTGSGLFYTLKLLFLKPEMVLSGYIAGKRKIYFSPIKLFLISGVLYISMNHLVNKGGTDTQTETIAYYLEHYKYLMIFGPAVLTACVNSLLYKKGLSFTENFVVSMYIQSTLYLMSTIFMLINYFGNFKIMSIGMILEILFYGYLVSRFYNKNKYIGLVINSFLYLIIIFILLTPIVLIR